MNEEGPIEYVTESGVKVKIANSPSREACERFVRVMLDIKGRYGIE